jgi:hypothetical protein
MNPLYPKWGKKMKYKILAILTGIIFLINIVAVANPTSYELKENKTTNFDDPVPAWSVGDYWTYTFTNFTVDYDYGDIKIYLSGKIDDFKWTVTSISGTDYVVDITGKITADFYEIYMPISTRILHVTGSIKPSLTTLSGTIVFTQSDLEVKSLSAMIKGIISAKISPLPFALPIPFKITVDSSLSGVFPIFDFPLSDDKYWSMPALDITNNINVGGKYGLIKIPFTLATSYSWIPFAFHCKPKVDITVEAGTYNAYEIESTFFEMFDYYYAPSAGNLVKIDATMPNGAAHGELKETNFS